MRGPAGATARSEPALPALPPADRRPPHQRPDRLSHRGGGGGVRVGTPTRGGRRHVDPRSGGSGCGSPRSSEHPKSGGGASRASRPRTRPSPRHARCTWARRRRRPGPRRGPATGTRRRGSTVTRPPPCTARPDLPCRPRRHRRAPRRRDDGAPPLAQGNRDARGDRGRDVLCRSVATTTDAPTRSRRSCGRRACRTRAALAACARVSGGLGVTPPKRRRSRGSAGPAGGTRS